MRETIVQSESGREITTVSDMTRSKDQDDDRYHVQILSRAIAVLFTFTPRTPEMTLDAFAERLDLNKTSLLRILRTLEHERFVIREGERYRLGPRVLELGNVYLSSLSVQEIARGPMERLARELGQTVSLAILDGLDVVYIGIEHAQREVGIQGEVGGRHLAGPTLTDATVAVAVYLKAVRERRSSTQAGAPPISRVVETEFVAAAAVFARAHSIEFDTWRRFGVEPAVLRRARISPRHRTT